MKQVSIEQVSIEQVTIEQILIEQTLQMKQRLMCILYEPHQRLQLNFPRAKIFFQKQKQKK